MEYAASHHVRRDVSCARRGVAAFLDNLHVEDNHGARDQQNWVARWTAIGDELRLLGNLNIKKGAFDEATENWLCALTAFEIARRLVGEVCAQSENISAKIETCIQSFGLSPDQKIERVQIPFWDQSRIVAYYVSAGGSDLCAPAAICISKEEEAGTTLLGRLLPEVIRRGMSVLVVSHEEIANHSAGQSEILLTCCFDYLSVRPNVDASRIGIYGEGLSAALATDFAASDRRVAAAVCDGGLWNWARALASVDWIAGTTDMEDEAVLSARRSRLMQQLTCPVLVIAGGRGIISVSEAIKLQTECTAAHIDLQLAIPRMTPTPAGEIEDFVTSDDCIFGWLEHKLTQR